MIEKSCFTCRHIYADATDEPCRICHYFGRPVLWERDRWWKVMWRKFRFRRMLNEYRRRITDREQEEIS